jgi:thiol:disulfide interchange protein DsbC
VACDHPIDRNVALARSLGFNATPTMVSGDGRKLEGAVGPEQITAFLDQPKLAQVPK